MKTLIKIKKVGVESIFGSRKKKILSNVSLSLKTNHSLALIGETGSGKTMVAKLILDLLPEGCIKTDGSISYSFGDGANSISALRGGKISTVFQDPAQSLNPVHTIGKQFIMVLKKHFKGDKSGVEKHACDWLEKVGLESGGNVLARYPHQLSGGQLQRVMIALAMSISPDLFLADEVTTGLDARVKKEVLDLLFSLQKEYGLSVLLITHDLYLIKKYCDSVAVIKSGTIVESGCSQKTFNEPKSEYLRAMLRSYKFSEKMVKKTEASKSKKVLLRVSDIKKTYNTSSGVKTILKNISFDLYSNETLGVIGESGSGKTTLAKIILNIQERNSGSVIIRSRNGKDIVLQAPTNKIGVVFQDSMGSLNPKMKVEKIISEPLMIDGSFSDDAIKEKLKKIIKEVDLEPELLRRYPRALSGGQRQRVSIARSIINNPEILIFDEPTSALDINVKGKILDLLIKLKIKNRLSYIFISHDIKAIAKISDRLIVLGGGAIVESGPIMKIIKNPTDMRTKELMRDVSLNIDIN